MLLMLLIVHFFPALPEELLVVCPQLSDPIGGSVTISADVVPGSRAMYSCDDKHQLSGPSVRECQEDGTWSESEPTCEGIWDDRNSQSCVKFPITHSQQSSALLYHPLIMEMSISLEIHLEA